VSGTPLLVIDFGQGRVRRYVRRELGLGVTRLDMSHEAVLEVTCPETLPADLESFRTQPREFPQDHIPDGAA